VDLHVHKHILRHISAFFHDFFAGAGNPDDLRRDEKPILILESSSTVLHRLLCIMYPGRSLDHYSAVHKAAQKDLFTGAKDMLQKMLEETTPLNVSPPPHRIFAIARKCELDELARKVALWTLNSSLCPRAPTFPELELVTAQDLQKLYNSH
ncbi:hypothetical protein DFH09DRAFT_831842, partial [Mycena vulgaris]